MVAAGIKSLDGQQAQNQLDHLVRYGLIFRDANEGVVRDSSRYVYSKEPHVRAHRTKIVSHADKPGLAKSIPTKRNPVMRGTVLVKRAADTKRVLKTRKHLDVLYLMANPIIRHSLRVDAEVKSVGEEIRRSLYRENITLHQLPAVNLDAIVHGLNDHRPRVVHFSGHGSASGVAVDEGGVKRVKRGFVTFDILGKAFAATDNPPDVVVLSACNSAGARTALLRSAKAIIVMQDAVSDIAAFAFATKFYGAIASGQSLKSAFEQGLVAVEAVSLNEAATPLLISANGVDTKKLFLA